MKGKFLYPDLSYKIRGCCFDLYKELGCGYKEIIYHRGLLEKLKKKNLKVSNKIQIPIFVEGKKVGIYVPDLIVENKILVEVKVKSILIRQDIRQLWYYLKGTSYKLGFLINFGKPGGVEIIRRIYDTARKVSSV